VDAFLDGAADFELADDPVSVREREQIAAAIETSQDNALRRAMVNPNVASFLATVPNGGIKTNRDNHWVVTLEVAWEDRGEVTRIIDTIPMNLLVTIVKPDD
jgi:hypothetical protein